MANDVKTHLLEDGIVDTTTTTSSSSVTPMLVFTAFVALLGSFTFGYSIGFTSPVQSQIMRELGLSTSQFSFFASMINVGSAICAVICGKVTDFLGRKRAVGLAALLYIVGWLLIAIGQDVWLLDLGRFMLGFAMTFIGYAVPVYIAEFTPKNLRGGFVILHLLMITIGSSSVYLVGLLISWRTLALIGVIPSLIQIIGLFFIPESPRWLMMIGRLEEMKDALQRLRGASANILQEAADMKESAEAQQQLSKVTIFQLFQKKYTYVLTVGIGLSALSSLVGLNGIIFYASSIFESAGVSEILGTVAIALFQLPSVICGVIFLDKCGRRPLLMISAAGLCIGCLLTGLSFVLRDHYLLESFSPYVALIGVLTYVASYPIGVGGVSAVILSEIYPINVKGLAGSVSAFINCTSGWLVAYVFNFFMAWSASGTFFILASICGFALIFAAKLVPETKGRTLEEVHKSISHVWQ